MIVSLILTKPRFFAQCAELMSLGGLFPVFWPKTPARIKKTAPKIFGAAYQGNSKSFF
jgi:hypothetical protein